MSSNAARRSRRQQKAATRGQIKEAARACFARSGYDATNIADIAAAAAVAHGTFYVHFANKAELLDELLVEFNDGLAAKLEPVFTAATGPRAHAPAVDWLTDTVRTTAEIFLDYWHEQRDFIACYAQRLASPGLASSGRSSPGASKSASGLDRETLRDGANPPMFALLSGALMTIAARAHADRHDLELVAHGLLAMWLRIGMQYLFNDRVTREGAIDALVRMSIGAVGAVLADADAPIGLAIDAPSTPAAPEDEP